jgi:hypothetical protein
MYGGTPKHAGSSVYPSRTRAFIAVENQFPLLICSVFVLESSMPLPEPVSES